MAEIIAVANQKGGIGKTTTALAITSVLRSMGKKTLFIDMDPQCNGTDTYKARIKDTGTIYDLIIDGDPDCIQHTAQGDIIAGDPTLKDAVKLLDGVAGSHRLREGLESIQDQYDYIILDTPPALTVLLTNALTAANRVLIPLTLDRYGLQGLVQLRNSILDIKKYTNNKDLVVDGLLIVKYNGRTNLDKGILESLPEYAKLFNTRIYETRIRESVKAREAQAQQVSLYAWAPNCTTALDYRALVKEMLGNIK